MFNKLSRILAGVIIVIALAGAVSPHPVIAQGDWKPITRVQEDQWCTSRGYLGVTAKTENPQTVNSFPYCLQRDGALVKVDMVQLCRDLYGEAYANPQYWDYNNYDSWYCNHTTAPDPAPVPPQPAPIPQPVPAPQPGGGNTGGTGGGSGENPKQPENPKPQPLPPLVYGSSSPVGTRSLRISATDGLNIRSGPGTNYSIIGRAVNGGYFEILSGPENGWYKIRFSGGEGWVSANYVQVVQSASAQGKPDQPIEWQDYNRAAAAWVVGGGELVPDCDGQIGNLDYIFTFYPSEGYNPDHYRIYSYNVQVQNALRGQSPIGHNLTKRPAILCIGFTTVIKAGGWWNVSNNLFVWVTQ